MRAIPAMIVTVLSLTAAAFAAAGQGMGWYDEDIWKKEDRAFLWYPDKKRSRKPEPNPQAPAPQNELVAFELLQKWVEEARKVAIMNPTEANLKRYIQLQEVVLGKSAAFTDQWQRVLWQNPQLDYAQHSRPTNKLAMEQYDYSRHQEKQRAIKQLAASNGILFVFRSDCPYCHAMAPIMKEFSRLYGIRVMPVSVDGVGIPMYPQPLPNNGIVQRLNVQTVPAVYIMDAKTRQFKPLGFGVMSQSVLEDRFLAYSKPVGSLY